MSFYNWYIHKVLKAKPSDEGPVGGEAMFYLAIVVGILFLIWLVV